MKQDTTTLATSIFMNSSKDKKVESGNSGIAKVVHMLLHLTFIINGLKPVMLYRPGLHFGGS